MKLKVVLFVWVLVLAVMSCKEKKLTPLEYLEKVDLNPDLNKEHQEEPYILKCSYKPTEYLTLMEFRNLLEKKDRVSLEKYNSVKKQFDNAYYFLLTIGLNDNTDILKYGVTNTSSYTQRINDITFNMGKQVYLLTDKNDTINCILHDFQRSYSMSPHATILFAFPKTETGHSKLKEFDFVFDDRNFGIPNPVYFKFKTNQLEKEIPTINITSNE